MPSNSLAAVYGLACGAAEREILGPDLPIDVFAIDETNTRVRPGDIAKRIAENGGLGLVGFVGVQSNEFPRTLDLARSFRAAGVQVMIGGFHVSGCLAMLKEIAGRHQGRPRAWRLHLRRRGRGGFRRGAARRCQGRAEAAL